MYLRCPECKTRYEIGASSIPEGGARVRCPRCRTVFTVSRPGVHPVGADGESTAVLPGAPREPGHVPAEPDPVAAGANSRNTARSETVHSETGRSESVRSETVHAESVRSEPLASEASRAEMAYGEPVLSTATTGARRDPASDASTADAMARAMGFPGDARDGDPFGRGAGDADPAPFDPAPAEPASLEPAAVEAATTGAGPEGVSTPTPTDSEPESEVAAVVRDSPARRDRLAAGAPRPHPAAANVVTPGAPVEPDLARRIARALISELLMARRDQRNEALREGRILARLGPAILEASDRYRERVGVDLAEGTRYFQDAVNDILGDGRTLV